MPGKEERREEDGKTDLGIGWRTNYVQLSNPARKASRISAPHVRGESGFAICSVFSVGRMMKISGNSLFRFLLKNLRKDSTLFNRTSTAAGLRSLREI